MLGKDICEKNGPNLPDYRGKKKKKNVKITRLLKQVPAG
jgi:hypothetical protein